MMLPLCREEGIGVIPWSPLARGYLARRSYAEKSTTTRGESDDFAAELITADDDAVIRRNAGIADRLGLKPAQLALAWLLAKPGISAPIIGASRLSHLDDAWKALEIRLGEAEIDQLEELYRPHPVVGFR